MENFEGFNDGHGLSWSTKLRFLYVYYTRSRKKIALISGNLFQLKSI